MWPLLEAGIISASFFCPSDGIGKFQVSRGESDPHSIAEDMAGVIADSAVLVQAVAQVVLADPVHMGQGSGRAEACLVAAAMTTNTTDGSPAAHHFTRWSRTQNLT